MFGMIAVFDNKLIIVSGVKNPKAVREVVDGIANQLGWSLVDDKFDHERLSWTFYFQAKGQMRPIEAPLDPTGSIHPDII